MRKTISNSGAHWAFPISNEFKNSGQALITLMFFVVIGFTVISAAAVMIIAALKLSL